MTTFLVTGSLGTLVGCDSLWQYAMLWCMTCIPFFTTLWEENTTGYFYLPIVNGVGEGTLAACIVCNTVGIFSRLIFMNQVVLFGKLIYVRDITVFCFFICGPIFAVIK
jgi:hypothetical protein